MQENILIAKRRKLRKTTLMTLPQRLACLVFTIGCSTSSPPATIDNQDRQDPVLMVPPGKSMPLTSEPVATQSINQSAQNIPSPSPSENSLVTSCVEQLAYLPAPLTNAESFAYCEQMQHMDSCRSLLGKPILHFDKASSEKRFIKILVLSTIHGDEGAAGSLARDWVVRLQSLEPRSQWRVLPILNPDGLKAGTRTNAGGVDLNRNFPTADWATHAQAYWRSKGAAPRRFPGNVGGSEPETQCIVKHIEDYQPDFIISVHTPYGVLDFDGPSNIVQPKSILPWRRLGHMPGSLGRFMWKDKQVPVLTIELKGGDVLERESMEQLQDVIGTVAIRSLKSLGRW